MPEKTNKGLQAYNQLEALITFQAIKPGTMVSEGELMAITGLGRSPIRDALQHLARDRMVELHPRRGIIIPVISAEVQLKLLEVRRSVEELAVRLASRRVTTTSKLEMLRFADVLLALDLSTDIRVYGQHLKGVHRSIVSAAQNDYLHLAMAPLQGLSRRFWFANLALQDDPLPDLRRGAELHAATLQAICRNDEQAAALGSLALNDYLTEFTYGTLRGCGARV